MKDLGTERGGRSFRERVLVATPPRAVIGLEAEFNLLVNGRRRRPEKVFGDPSRLVRRRMIPRTGKSFQFAAGGAIYLDTGVIAVVVQTVLRWEDFGLRQWNRHAISRITPFRLRKHSSRRGWRVTAESLGQNPFTSNINAPLWKLRDGRLLSLRAIAAEILTPFHRRIRQIGDSSTLEHITAIFDGDARSLLDFAERPQAYDNVGRTIDWGRRRMRRWSRSKYEKTIHRMIAREPVRLGGKRYCVDRMNGWYQVEFREVG